IIPVSPPVTRTQNQSGYPGLSIQKEVRMSTLTAKPRATVLGTIRNILASHPLVSYFVLAFAGTWLFVAPMVLGQDGLGLLPYSVPFGLYVGLFLASSFTGPTLAAVAVTFALEGKAGLSAFFRRYVQWRI